MSAFVSWAAEGSRDAVPDALSATAGRDDGGALNALRARADGKAGDGSRPAVEVVCFDAVGRPAEDDCGAGVVLALGAASRGFFDGDTAGPAPFCE